MVKPSHHLCRYSLQQNFVASPCLLAHCYTAFNIESAKVLKQGECEALFVVMGCVERAVSLHPSLHSLSKLLSVS
jgi:hypothetical protein